MNYDPILDFVKRRQEKNNRNKKLDKCKICGNRYKDLRGHVFRVHLMNMTEYKNYKV